MVIAIKNRWARHEKKTPLIVIVIKNLSWRQLKKMKPLIVIVIKKPLST